MNATPQTTALRFFNGVTNLVASLYGRWLSEKDFEDINDYKQPFDKVAVQYGVTITKMTKRPFGFEFKTELGTYTLSIKQGAVSYKRTA